MGTRSLHGLWVHLAAAGALATAGLAGVAALAPAGAAQATTAMAAPYQAADHTTTQSCARGSVMPSCTSSSAADPGTGAMNASSAVDSGMAGNVPGAAASEATSEIHPTIAIGDASAATFTFHVHVNRVEQAATGLGRSNVIIWAAGMCDGCALPSDQYVFPDGPGDQTLAVTLLRGSTGGHLAHLNLGLSASSAVACDDFCIMPSGTARALSQVIVKGVDVKLWGLGRPVVPVIETPAPRSTVTPATFATQCDPQCQNVYGERVAGVAEPGMPVVLRDGNHQVTAVQADETGHWLAYVALPAGAHSVSAIANGAKGTAASAPRAFTVAG